MNRLKRYVEDPDMSPQAAARDNDEWIVEAARDYKWEGKQLFIRIGWEGFSQEEDSWEPYDKVQYVTWVDEYVKKHNLLSNVTSRKRNKTQQRKP